MNIKRTDLKQPFLTSRTFGFFPNSHSLFLVLLIACFGSDRGAGPTSLSLSPLGVLLMVPSEPVLLRFWLKSSKGKSPGGSKPDLNDSTTMTESWKKGQVRGVRQNEMEETSSR